MREYVPLIDKIDRNTKGRGLTERKEKPPKKLEPTGFLEHLNDTFT